MKRNPNKDILTFIILVFALSIIPYVLIYNAGGTDSNWVMLLMWTPALAGIFARMIGRQSLFKGLGWNPLKSFKWMILAMLIPLLVSTVYLFLLFGLGLADYNTGFIIKENNLVTIRGVAMIFGAAPQHVLLLAGNFILSFFVGNLIYMLAFTLGEEYGWRAHLQPLFVDRFGVRKGLFILGLVWGYWHLPGILMGHNFPEYPLLGGFILMPLACVGLSYAFGMSYLKTGVLWVPVMFHSAFNMVSDIHSSAIAEGTKNVLGADIIYISLWGLVGWFCLRYLKTRKNMEEAEGSFELPH